MYDEIQILGMGLDEIPFQTRSLTRDKSKYIVDEDGVIHEVETGEPTKVKYLKAVSKYKNSFFTVELFYSKGLLIKKIITIEPSQSRLKILKDKLNAFFKKN